MPDRMEQIYEVNNELSVCLWEILNPSVIILQVYGIAQSCVGNSKLPTSSCPRPPL